ncbi:MAG: hypothetical protein MUE44_07045 [Oscillatoriaceae cyanobacterium Prado104]|nr:hypothetical protein [Oscillatoriaceae cyanobacterium Prado104]
MVARQGFWGDRAWMYADPLVCWDRCGNLDRPQAFVMGAIGRCGFCGVCAAFESAGELIPRLIAQVG